MNIQQKTKLFHCLIEAVKDFNENNHLKLSTNEVEELTVEFGVFFKRFVRGLRERG